MLRYRPEISAMSPYVIGRPIADVAAEVGLDPSQIVRMTANESPLGPFDGVAEAVAEAAGDTRRYPDNEVSALRTRLADELAVPPYSLNFGNGSVALICEALMAICRPGSNVIYGWPGFDIYRAASIWAGAEPVEVPVDPEWRVDLDAMAARVNDNTAAVILCNPNNPTGTTNTADSVREFAESLPEHVLLIVDEAYHEYVTDPGYATAIPLALELPNVMALRTFSKIYSLAAMRVGYSVADPSTTRELRKTQQPLTVNSLGQAAALASLGQPDEVRRRRDANAAGRHHIMGVLTERGLPHAASQSNFVYFRVPNPDPSTNIQLFARNRIILRGLPEGWIRVSVGDEEENEIFVRALDAVLDESTD